ncbi:MAG: DegT/DnrJ/EryC1/StrS family aminotransferase, partial [Bacteroidales bacterium]|nr:DegT/DnrJ/EryC1/StrS family aminotransferase [Bacteroidales bacterium]
YLAKRQQAAQLYNEQLAKITSLKLPHLNSSHTFNQYTITLLKGNRTELQEHLKKVGIPSTIYYPLPLHLQPAFKYLNYKRGSLPISEQLSEKVLSLPMHSELDEEQITFIVNQIINYYNR